MSKRILSLVLAMVMVLGTFGMVFAEGPTANEKVNWLIDQGIVTGNENGDYMLDKTIDRASVAKMVVEALDLKAVAAGMQNYKTAFSDVPVTHWSNGNINVVSARGLMVGNAGEFMPSNQISYAEVLTILVRMMDGLTADEEKVAVWPTTYIAKAHEMGILEDVNVVSYQEPALREAILEMFYNAMTNMEVGNYHVVKGIVLENYRVESLDKDEIVIEVIQEVQRAEFAKENRKGDQLSLRIPAKVADVEDLLGKVADFSINKAGDVVKVTVDETYKYEVGALKAYDDYLTVANKEYTVVKDERWEDRDDRVFRTYIDNKSHQYSKYATSDKVAKEAEFARVTTKNGKVLFIDAFTFDDVAPVKEVRNDGKTVYIYDDNNDGLEKRLSFNARTKVVKIEDKVMNVASLEDIDALDVIHYNTDSNTVFVRQDAAVVGEYERYRTTRVDDQNAIDIYVDGEAYDTRFAPSRKAVWSMDGEEFETLERNEVSSKLERMRKLEVTLLLDMNDRVQYVSAGVEDTTFVALVDNILSRSVRFQKADGESIILDATMDTVVTIDESTTYRNLNALEAGDLVKVWSKDGEIVKVELIEDARTITAKAEDNMYTRFNSTYITIDSEDYVLDRKASVFVDLDHSPWRKGMPVAEFAKLFKTYNDGKDLGEVFIIEDAGVVTHIVFKSVDGIASRLLPAATVRVTDIFGYGTRELYEIEFERTNGEIETRRVAKGKLVDADDNVIEAGDIVSIVLENTEDENVHSITQLIDADEVVYEVIGIDSANRITLQGKNGVEDRETLPMLRSAAHFGYVSRGEFVSISTNAAGYVNAIEVRDNVWYEVGTWEVPVNKAELTTAIADALAKLEDADLYTEESVTALNAAVAAANTVVANEEATQEEVDAAVAALEAAIEGLEAKPAVLTLKAVQADAVDETMAPFGIYSVSVEFENAKAKLADVTEESVLTLTLEDETVIELEYDGDTFSFANWDIQGVDNAEALYNGVIAIK